MKKTNGDRMMQDNYKYALLIDADNVSQKYIDTMLSEAKLLGDVTIRRIYGDWTSNTKSSWKEILLENSITPIQQYTYTTGKNSSDSAMIIDAMDILYEGSVEGFIIASSDSDFTRLAMRLREAGKDVIGMGESKTPSAFVKACRIFKTLDVLYRAQTSVSTDTGKSKAVDNSVPDSELIAPITSQVKIQKKIRDIIDEQADVDGWLFLGELGNYLLREYPDFDYRNYGYKKLVEMVKAYKRLEVKQEKKLVYVRIRPSEK